MILCIILHDVWAIYFCRICHPVTPTQSVWDLQSSVENTVVVGWLSKV